jgi:hypothetical protein
MAEFDSLMLHDATLIDINFNWLKSVTTVKFKKHDGIYSIQFSSCTNLSIPHECSWGESNSINSFSNKGCVYKIEMQSGDLIVINASGFSMV